MPRDDASSNAAEVTAELVSSFDNGSSEAVNVTRESEAIHNSVEVLEVACDVAPTGHPLSSQLNVSVYFLYEFWVFFN